MPASLLCLGLNMNIKTANSKPFIYLDFGKGGNYPGLQVTRASVKNVFSPDGLVSQFTANQPARSYSGNFIGLDIFPGNTTLLYLSMPPAMADSLYPGSGARWYGVSGLEVKTYTGPDIFKSNIKPMTLMPKKAGTWQQLAGDLAQNLVSGNRYVFSCYMRKEPGAATDEVGLLYGDDNNAWEQIYGRFKLSGNGSVISISSEPRTFTSPKAGIEYLTGGWYRVWISAFFKPTASYTKVPRVYIYPGMAPSSAIGDGAAIWLPQIELGDLPTPPMNATGSPVSSAADSIVLPQAFTEGTFFFDVCSPRNENVTDKVAISFENTDKGIYVDIARDGILSVSPTIVSGLLPVKETTDRRKHCVRISKAQATLFNQTQQVSIANPIANFTTIKLGSFMNSNAVLRGQFGKLIGFTELLSDDDIKNLLKLL